MGGPSPDYGSSRTRFLRRGSPAHRAGPWSSSKTRGKSVVGLLAAQSSLNEGIGLAAYLVPDTYLAKQVIDEAHQLGLAVTDDPAQQYTGWARTYRSWRLVGRFDPCPTT